MNPAGVVTRRRVWLWLTAALFAGWIVWLGHLAFTTGRAWPAVSAWRPASQPVILRRAQFLVCDVAVVGQVQSPRDGEVTVREVAWSRAAAPPLNAGQKVHVTNLAECQGWHGPGEYLLPLLRTDEGTFEVADPTGLPEDDRKAHLQKDRKEKWLPSESPGYSSYDPETKALRPPQIYPATPEALAQLRQIHPQP